MMTRAKSSCNENKVIDIFNINLLMAFFAIRQEIATAKNPDFSVVTEKNTCYDTCNENKYGNNFTMIERTIFNQIKSVFFNRNVILLFGTRRVGKTTLLEQLLEYYESQGKRYKYMNCDTIRHRQELDTTDDQLLREVVRDVDILAVDEAQNVETIGKTFKIIYDTFPHVQVIATGSSSFDLANKTGEPLVGRMRRFLLYPFSMEELRSFIGVFNVNYNVQKYLKYGLYPTVCRASENEAITELETFVGGYLYKDLFTFDGIRNSEQILTLLQLLALQIGSEVSYFELANSLRMSVNTVQKYIQLLEQCYVIFKLPAFSRNMRNEISGNRTRKIYFYDIGVRNALINNYQNMEIRPDAGGIWENFCIVELKKKAQREGRTPGYYFWRTKDGKEVDLIEEKNGEYNLYEFKLSSNKKAKIPKGFAENYNVKSFNVINKENWYQFF